MQLVSGWEKWGYKADCYIWKQLNECNASEAVTRIISERRGEDRKGGAGGARLSDIEGALEE